MLVGNGGLSGFSPSELVFIREAEDRAKAHSKRIGRAVKAYPCRTAEGSLRIVYDIQDKHGHVRAIGQVDAFLYSDKMIAYLEEKHRFVFGDVKNAE